MQRYWSKEMDLMLRDLSCKGFSRARIAEQICSNLNVVVSRNAVCGRAARLGISQTVERASQIERAKRALDAGNRTLSQALKRRARPKNRTAIVGQKTVAEEAPIATPPPAQPLRSVERGQEWVALPESRRVSIVDLRAGLCHWPLWDGPKAGAYCGADCDIGKRYCPSHTRLSVGQGTPGERTAHKIGGVS
jgi:GcrA cell cycle regulator